MKTHLSSVHTAATSGTLGSLLANTLTVRIFQFIEQQHKIHIMNMLHIQCITVILAGSSGITYWTNSHCNVCI